MSEKRPSEQRLKFVDRQSSLPNDGAQRPFGDLAMVRHGQASVWRVFVAKRDVAAPLVVREVAELF
jgi:hypothetical protein